MVMEILERGRRRFALACLLVKSEVGVQDAWVRDGMTKAKAEADALIAQIVAGAEAVEISMAYLSRGLPMHSRSMLRDVAPPFALLQVAETLALGPLHPESISPPALVCFGVFCGLQTQAAAALVTGAGAAGGGCAGCDRGRAGGLPAKDIVVRDPHG
jgi:hypothetical protein